MLTKMLIIFAIFVGILICLRIIVKSLSNSGDQEKADGARAFERQIFDGMNGFVQNAQKVFARGQVGVKPDMQDMVIGTVLDAGAKGIDYLNPSRQERKAVVKLITEAKKKLAQADANATRLGWQEAKDYVAECLKELDDISDRSSRSSAPSEFEMHVRQIIADAEEIAAKQTADSSKQAEPGPTPKKTYYDILGVDKNATEAEIKKAHRELAQKYHPDKYQHLAEDMQKIAEERFKEINEAYSTLSNQTQRTAYDKTL